VLCRVLIDIFQADAVSGNTQMNAALWDEFHKFRLEWELPQAEMGDGASEGYVRWYMDDALVYGISGESLSNKMKGSQVVFYAVLFFNLHVKKEKTLVRRWEAHEKRQRHQNCSRSL